MTADDANTTAATEAAVDSAMTSALPEPALVRHSQGEPEAFAEFVQTYRSKVYGYLVYSQVDANSRDDLFQEIFLLVHRHTRRYDATRPVEPWLFSIVINSVRDYFRKTKRIGKIEISTQDSSEAGCLGDALDSTCSHGELEGTETARWLTSALGTLPPDQREAIILCCVRGLDQAEASRILEIPVNTLKTNLRRGRLTLAKALAERNAQIAQEVRR